ncbi:hypothetical protein FACS1894185_1530 [Betaproteobacteria bacterium]|nr:hypothetical protein FACS1894185_1530 [Betaproteobacteria bacterium]GHU14367.1 hypothetical protein FACS189441_3830 [Betaproteobacteria bacterium]
MPAITQHTLFTMSSMISPEPTNYGSKRSTDIMQGEKAQRLPPFGGSSRTIAHLSTFDGVARTQV